MLGALRNFRVASASELPLELAGIEVERSQTRACQENVLIEGS